MSDIGGKCAHEVGAICARSLVLRCPIMIFGHEPCVCMLLPWLSFR